MTLSSLVAFLSFADLGIGNGLVNAVAAGHGRDDPTEIRRVISSAALALSAISVLIITLFAVLYPFVPWARLVNARSALAANEAGPALAIFVVSAALSIPANIVQKIQLGVQRGYVNSAWQAGGSVLGLLLVLIAIFAKAGLPWLVAAITGGPLLATIANGVTFFGVRRPMLRPKPREVAWPVARALAGSGLLFLVLQLSSAVAFGSDNIIIARMLGPASVAGYAIATRLFAVVQQANFMLVGPLWPAYREAIVRGDKEWVRRYLKRSVLLSIFITASLGVALVFSGRHVIHWWVGNKVSVDAILLPSLAAWLVVEGLGVTISMFLYATGSIASQAALAAGFAIICLGARIWSVRRFGVVGIPIATTICYCTLMLLPVIFMARSRLTAILRGA
jgi:O-antigen/teichoic acid export membrane protein